MSKKKLDEGHNDGFNRDDNNWGDNKRKVIIPDGEPVLEPEGMPREEYDGNLDPIPDDRINLD